MPRDTAQYNTTTDPPEDEPTTRAQTALEHKEQFANQFMGDPDEWVDKDSILAQGTDYARGVLNELQNRTASDFAYSCLEGDATQADIAKFLTDPRRVGLEYANVITTYFEVDNLTPEETTEWLHALDISCQSAGIRFGTADVSANASHAARETLYDAATTLMLHKHDLYPFPQLEHQDPAAGTVFDSIVDSRYNNAYNRFQAHAEITKLHDTVTTIGTELKHLQETGEYPDWFDQQELSVSPELAAQGYNLLHNQPIDLLDDPRYIESYLSKRLEHYRQIAADTSAYMPTAASAGRLLLKPYLDQKLSADFAHHDAPDSSYEDDGPINYEEPTGKRFLLDAIDDPATHASTSYCRAIRDALMNRGIADDIYMGRSDLLAMSLPRNAQALERIAETLHHAVERPPPRDESTQFTPIIEWDKGSPEAWRKIHQMTDGFESTHALADLITQYKSDIHHSFTFDDLYEPDNPFRMYSFIHLPQENQYLDQDLPQRRLLREAVDDINRAHHTLEQIQNLIDKAPENAASNLRVAERNLDDMKQRGYPETTLEALRDYINHEIATSAEPIETALHFESQAKSTFPDIKDAALEYLYRHQTRIAYFDDVIRHLAHADFNLQVIMDSRNLPTTV